MLFRKALLFTALSLYLLPGIAAGAPPFTDPPKSKEKKKSKTDAQPAATLTGCVDERDGQYVLTDDRNLQPFIDVEGDGFAREGFAKYVGHKVEVKGRKSVEDGRSVFRVRTITVVSETCSPPKQQ